MSSILGWGGADDDAARQGEPESQSHRIPEPHETALAFYGESLILAHLADVRSIEALAALGRSALLEARRDGIRGMASDMELRSVAAEAATLCRLTDRQLQRRIEHALVIVDDFPTVFAAWRDWVIERGHVEIIVRAGDILPDDVRPDFERAAIAACERDIPSRVRPVVEMLAQTMNPQSFSERHREAAAGRCVRAIHGRDGMSDVIATLPTVIAAGMLDRLTQMAQTVKDANKTDAQNPDRNAAEPGAIGFDAAADPADRRTMDQIRADVLADLVLSGAPVVEPRYGADSAGPLGAIRAHVQVVVAASTLTGADEHPADAVGAALVDADTARRLAGQTASWDRLFIDPVTRTPVEVDQYRPPQAMRRLLQARDEHCRFPGCRRAAIRCELDHTIDWAKGGHTHIFNLAHLCQRHHSMKQFTEWQVRQIGGGALEWTSPLGRVYREDVPIPAVCFIPDTGTPPSSTVGAALSGPPDPPPF